MARGLSPLQKDILRVFNQCHSALTTQEILMRLYFDPCPRSSPEVVTNTVRRALIRFPAERFDHGWPKSAWTLDS
jgi:hypothetical protein